MKMRIRNTAGRELGVYDVPEGVDADQAETLAIHAMCIEGGYTSAQQAYDKRFFHPDRVIVESANDTE